MKASQMMTNRFSSPSPLDPTTVVRGATIAEWEAAFTNGFKHTFTELAERKRQYLLKRARMKPFNGVFRRNSK
ncbi:hypothetical protein GJ700_03020 [Duganella sp. FT92W]|uniref:Uncharacterized protein n=1 Tax=Pseudoduganella rivuli TaxID=2666085 RepID=A0A7X2IJJ8_9BURK|nr:hypothetical protein [Pseudoduganella rivuli]MRV70688.1 hypothetical protein [Pseudoduganella rivuli]